MPMWYLYALGGFLYFFLYRVFGFRKKVVVNNLKNSFPDKSEQEIKKITKQFYWHMTNLIVESIKIFSISSENASRRMKVANPEELDKHFDAGKSVIMCGGHYANWELFAVAVDQKVKHQTYGVYTPLSNQFMDTKMKDSRGKYGLKMIPGKKVKPVIEDAMSQKTDPVGVILATDQSPSNPNNAYWLNFLNQDTGVLFGTEKYAKEYNLPVVYGKINRVKKGFYEVSFETLIENPSEMAYGEITKIHTSRLEKDIVARPELWLWSHKRWKKQRPENANQPR